MRHFVFMKLKDGTFDERTLQDYVSTFDALMNALPGDIFAVKVSRNAIGRPNNMDVMIEMRLKDESSLGAYLKHPLHVAIGERYNPLVQRIASFDTMEEGI